MYLHEGGFHCRRFVHYRANAVIAWAYISKLKTDFGRPLPERFDCSCPNMSRDKYAKAFFLYMYDICRQYLFLYNKKVTGRFP